MTQQRFVVLRHEVGPQFTRHVGLHCDWMFQVDDVLRTWATDPIDRFDRDFDVNGQKLDDHRVAYLDYEGPLSGDRGSVTRILGGDCTIISEGEDRLVARLAWFRESKSESGIVICQRIMFDSESPPCETRMDWSLSFALGR